MAKSSLFVVWICVLVLIGTGTGVLARNGLRINSDFLNIFESSQDGDFQKANAAYEKKFSDQLLFFVRHNDRELAIQAAEELAKKIRSEDIFAAVDLELGNSLDAESIAFLYSHRQALLSRDQIHKIQSGRSREIVDKALRQIYSPAGFSGQIASDPLFLFQDYFLQASKFFLPKPFKNYLVSEKNGYAVFLRAHLNKAATGFNGRLIDFYQTSKADFAQKNADIYGLGASLYAAEGSESSINEVKLYGTFSFSAILVLLTWCFSSLVPVVASLLTILLSVGAGFLTISLIYEQVHVFTLLMGVSILGIVTDYCTHFFAKRFDSTITSSEQAMKKIKRALALGFLSNILTYLCFYFTDLVVLQQLAVFITSGILVTYITVLAVFPKLKWRQLSAHGFERLTGLTSFWKRWRPERVFAVAIFLVILGFALSKGLKFNDDVRLLQGLNTGLKNDEDQVLSYLGAPKTTMYFLVRGSTPDEVLSREEELTRDLSTRAVRHLALSQFVPSESQQKESLSSYQTLKDETRELYQRIGVSESDSVGKIFSSVPPVLTVQEFFKRASGLPVTANWLGQIDGNYYAVTSILDDVSYESLKTLSSGSVFLVNKVAAITEFLRKLRETIMRQFTWVMLVLGVFLFALFRQRTAFFIIFPPLISAAATLVIVESIYGYLNLFNLLAVILIFCLGLDYSVFFAQSKGSQVATHVGVFFSFLSTIDSFGMLGFSNTHAISSFGISVFVGISLCYLLSPLAAGAEYV